jgi:hypothetical protein
MALLGAPPKPPPSSGLLYAAVVFVLDTACLGVVGCVAACGLIVVAVVAYFL